MEKIILTFFSLLTLNMVPPIHSNTNHNGDLTNELQYDGPYVHYKHDKIFVDYIIINNGKATVRTVTTPLQQKDSVTLNVATDKPSQSFQVKLKKELTVEKSEYPKATRLLVLSDIEGNFDAFRKLLLAANVIDEDLNWKFGDGQLVLVGDFFDRGLHVTEVLWFIYYLEDKAKAAGGYVHFVLGNHEIMNLSGDLRYVNPKYASNAALLRQNYVSLYDENSELGRWLRTKNIIEKIGDMVFTHGGISGAMNGMSISIPEINQLARPYYSDSGYNYNDKKTDIIYGDNGPFWYRGYYQKTNPRTLSQIDSTLSHYSINHIVTGHTIVSDTISVWYNGRLLNTDVHHAEGKSEALLIDNDKFFRVNQEGNKVLLMEGRLQSGN